MAFLNSNIPFFFAYLKKEFLYNDESHHGEFVDAEIFGFSSLQRRIPSFYLMTEYGSIHARVPLHYLVWKTDYKEIPKDFLSIWDCYSYTHSIIEYSYLKNSKCEVILKDGSKESGIYMFTIDWCNNSEFISSDHAERPDGHKCGHMIKLDSGMFVIQPNNRIWWYDAGAFIDPRERPNKIDWKIYSSLHSVEQSGFRWTTKDENIDYDYTKIDD